MCVGLVIISRLRPRRRTATGLALPQRVDFRRLRQHRRTSRKRHEDGAEGDDPGVASGHGLLSDDHNGIDAGPTASWRPVQRGRRVGYVSPHRCRSPPNRFARPGTREWS